MKIEEMPGMALAWTTEGKLHQIPVGRWNDSQPESHAYNDQPEESQDLGFMEFFDWLAKTKDQELLTIGPELGVPTAMTAPLTSHQREVYAKAVWEAM